MADTPAALEFVRTLHEADLRSTEGSAQATDVQAEATLEQHRPGRFVDVPANQHAVMPQRTFANRETSHVASAGDAIQGRVVRRRVAQQDVARRHVARSDVVLAPLVGEAEPVGTGAADAADRQPRDLAPAAIDVALALEVGKVVVARHPQDGQSERAHAREHAVQTVPISDVRAPEHAQTTAACTDVADQEHPIGRLARDSSQDRREAGLVIVDVADHRKPHSRGHHG